MISPFQIAQQPSLQFGWGIRNDFAPHLLKKGVRSAVLISGRFLTRPGEYGDQLIQQLQAADVRLSIFTVSGEPSPETVDEIVQACPLDVETVIGLGGGSVLDAAKAVAGLLPSRTSVMEYLEGVGKGRSLEGDTLPFIALPTTAGTGSETTKNAVLSRLGEFKKSFRSDKLLAQAVWLDPSFLATCPQEVLYTTGLDAFTQLLESYTTLKANPITDALAWQGITLFKGAFETLETGSESERQTAYGNLMLAASLSGITLANAGLGAVHGLAGPVGAFFEAPHGAVCARLLAPITQANIHTLNSDDQPQARATLIKYDQIARLFDAQGDTEEERLVQFIHVLDRLVERYSPTGLSAYGLTPNNLAPVLANCRSGSMLGNPVTLSDNALKQALLQAL